MADGSTHEVDVLRVEDEELARIDPARYFFDWTEETGQEVYKLVLQGQHDILGLISIEVMPKEWRVHVRLLTVSEENQGRGKMYDRIAGNLLAHAAGIAVREFGASACISLRPKTALEPHYMEKYNMTKTGVTLSLMVPEIMNLINTYN